MTAYYNEFDPGAAAWLRELIRRGLIADGIVDTRSILDVQPSDLAGFTQCHFFAGIGGWSYALRLAGWPDDRPVWTGSPPCQPFSAAGRQLGKDDERHLAPHFASLVAACRPGTLFGEQVASAAVFGKAASGTRKTADGNAAPEWAWLDDLLERLEAAHYACGASDIPAAGVGAAHIRQRTFFGACRLADSAGPRLEGAAGARLQGRSDRHASSSSNGGLADALHAGRPEWRPLAGDGSVAGGSSGLCGLADAGHGAGQRGVARPVVRGLPTADGAHFAAADASDSPWATADWLYCRDGKWRPVEPGTFPLAHGVSARVGRLRGYGNAIVPQAAAEFIKAFDAASAECFRLTDLSRMTTDNEGVFG